MHEDRLTAERRAAVWIVKLEICTIRFRAILQTYVKESVLFIYTNLNTDTQGLKIENKAENNKLRGDEILFCMIL